MKRQSRHKNAILRTAAFVTVVLSLTFAAVHASADIKTDCGYAKTDDERISACTKLIESKEVGDAVHAGGYLLRGLSYARKGQNDFAIRDYSSIIAYGPDTAPVFYRGALVKRAWIYILQNKLSQAIKDLDVAIKANPKESNAHHYRAYAYAKGRNFGKAIEDATAAIELRPDDADLYALRGGIHQETERKEEAIGDYRKALALKPTPGMEEAIKLNLKDLGVAP